jgi:hypothetical protein
MADAPRSEVVFTSGCPDTGRLVVSGLPRRLPDLGDDFDWSARDYDDLRLFMMEEIAARVPERRQWTPADLEVVIVEALAAALDRLSDFADRVAAEAFLETARRPESVRRLLAFLGHDAAREAFDAGRIAVDPARDRAGAEAALERAWAGNAWMMEAARAAGPRRIHEQRRMVTPEDHGRLLEEHPLVRHAAGHAEWGGAWTVVRAAVLPRVDVRLDDALSAAAVGDLRAAVDDFHDRHGIPRPAWASGPTLRSILAPFVERYRMVGRPALLEDAKLVGVAMAISVRVRDNYFQSEVRSAIDVALGRGPGGFFEPGRLPFGGALHLSDVIQVLTSLEGVETVCMNRFKRVGPRWLDQIASGRIALGSLDVPRCDNDPAHPERGYYHLMLAGGRRG